MLYTRCSTTGLATIAVLVVARLGCAEPLFTLADEGRTFLYRARPGDQPGAVAEMFGIRRQDVAALLAGNAISDPTRVSAGFVYRIPNAALLPVLERSAALEADNARLGQALAQAETRGREQSRDAEEMKTRAVQAEGRAARAARLEWLWPIGQAAIVVLLLGAAAATAVAVAALRRQRQAERFTRSLGEELEAKRKGSLLERQESSRRILELEERIRSLEVQLGPRVFLGGRRS